MTMGNMQSINLMIWSIAIADVDDFVMSTTWNKCKRVEFLKIRRRKIAYVIPLPVQQYWKIPLGWNFGGYVMVHAGNTTNGSTV